MSRIGSVRYRYRDRIKNPTVDEPRDKGLARALSDVCESSVGEMEMIRVWTSVLHCCTYTVRENTVRYIHKYVGEGRRRPPLSWCVYVCVRLCGCCGAGW